MKLVSVPVIDDTVTVIHKKLLLIVILNNDILTDDSDMESIAIEKLKQIQTLHKFLMHRQSAGPSDPLIRRKWTMC